MDITLLVVQYQHRHVLEQALKVVIYSIKLKLEFAILNKLIGITQNTNNQIHLKPIEIVETEPEGRKDSFFCGGSENEHAIDFEKGRVDHIERLTSISSLATVETIDQQRRRQRIEMDDYAEACRAVA